MKIFLALSLSRKLIASVIILTLYIINFPVIHSKETNHPFDEVRPLAETGLKLYQNGEKTEETLQKLQEALLRGQNWIRLPEVEELIRMKDDVNLGEDAELMAKVVEAVILLRTELREESAKELIFLMMSASVSSISNDRYSFENVPNIYPDFKEISDTPKESLKQAINLMETGKTKDAEKILLILYYDSWFNRNNIELKYDVANKLGLFYLKMKMPEKCYSVLYTNKIEMERENILNKDYVETLVYMGFAQLQKLSTPIIGNLFLEVADGLTNKINIDPQEIIGVYTKILRGKNIGNEIVSFIEDNDKNFYFLSEKERILRWANIKEEWEILKQDAFNESAKDIDPLLNAFQYEKQILLRSAIKVKEKLKRSENSEVSGLIDRLLKIKMDMTRPFLFDDRFDELDAEYQKIQKLLMHHEVLSNFQDINFNPVSVSEIGSKLNNNETFIDFGKININGTEFYVAILITSEKKGQIKPLMSVEELRNFISETESDDSKRMVEERYSNNFLYTKLWAPLKETGLIKDKIFYSPSDELNVIMLDAIRDKSGICLGEDHEFHILSSAENIAAIRNGERYVPEVILSFCDIDYVGDRETLIRIAQKFGNERPLKKHMFDVDKEETFTIHIESSLHPLHKKEEFDWFRNLDDQRNTKTLLVTGEKANEYLFKRLPEFKGALNISTHAFNLPRGYNKIGNHYVTYQCTRLVTLEPLIADLLPLYRTGLFLSGGERSWTGRNFIDDIEDGILNGEEISSLDLSGIHLVTLMACSSGKGEINEYEGIIGLRRAMKMAGCKTLITAAWNLDKDAAMTYLKNFYSNLVDGMGIPLSHRKAQLELIKKYEDPYYWAVFQLID